MATDSKGQLQNQQLLKNESYTIFFCQKIREEEEEFEEEEEEKRKEHQTPK